MRRRGAAARVFFERALGPVALAVEGEVELDEQAVGVLVDKLGGVLVPAAVVVGHSMGGYGATRIGMKHADVFGSVYIMSPCCLAPRQAGTPNPEVEKALEVWRRDEEIDAVNNSLFRELLTYMMEDPRNITSCTHLLFCTKNIERMGDHATNIAETVHYMVEGRPLADERPKGDDTATFTAVAARLG